MSDTLQLGPLGGGSLAPSADVPIPHAITCLAVCCDGLGCFFGVKDATQVGFTDFTSHQTTLYDLTYAGNVTGYVTSIIADPERPNVVLLGTSAGHVVMVQRSAARDLTIRTWCVTGLVRAYAVTCLTWLPRHFAFAASDLGGKLVICHLSEAVGFPDRTKHLELAHTPACLTMQPGGHALVAACQHGLYIFDLADTDASSEQDFRATKTELAPLYFHSSDTLISHADGLSCYGLVQDHDIRSAFLQRQSASRLPYTPYASAISATRDWLPLIQHVPARHPLPELELLGGFLTPEQLATIRNKAPKAPTSPSQWGAFHIPTGRILDLGPLDPACTYLGCYLAAVANTAYVARVYPGHTLVQRAPLVVPVIKDGGFQLNL